MGSRQSSIEDLMSRQQLSAQRTAEQAGQRHAARCVASATALLRTVFPDAAEVVLDLSGWYDNTGSVNLDTILDHEQAVLWRHTDIPCTEHSEQPPLPAEIMLARQQVEEAWNAFVRNAANYFELALDFGYPDTLGWEHVDPRSGDYTGPYRVMLPISPYLPDPRAADDDVDHERAAQPCHLHARSTDTRDAKPSGSSWLVTCTTHDAEADVYAGDGDLARAKFVCDRGRRWYFLARRRDDQCPPEPRSLIELADDIRSFLLAEKDPESHNGERWDQLVVHRYLTHHAECLPLDVFTRHLGAHKVLAAVREQDTPVPLPHSHVASTSDAYEIDGVTYLLVVIDLATDDGVVIEPSPEPLDRQNNARGSAHDAPESEATQLLPVPA